MQQLPAQVRSSSLPYEKQVTLKARLATVTDPEGPVQPKPADTGTCSQQQQRRQQQHHQQQQQQQRRRQDLLKAAALARS
jgi:hypothetical protein